MCQPHYYAAYKAGAIPVKRHRKRRSKLRIRITVDGCWLHRGSKTRQGYGAIGWGGRNHLAHRLTWALTHGPIPDGMQVHHVCRVPACCNPDHLRLMAPTEHRAAHWAPAGAA